ncbi:MAG TPA: hypothetical protein VHR84_05945 [Terriglobales bacterium]|nr:hypothetical protein [Terriglobales bacterium]
MPVRISRENCAARFFSFAIAFAFLAIQSVAAQSETAAIGLQGTWRVQVNLVNCSNGQNLGPSFSSLLMFNRGGTLSGTTRNAAFSPGQRTSDFGIWRQTGPNTYSADSEAFILFTSNLFQSGSQRITQSITLGGNSFESTAITRFYDTNGSLLISGCAHAVGTRYE